MEILDQKTRIDRISENGYEFDLQKYISEGWDLFRKAPLQLALYTLVVAGVALVLGIIPIVGSIASMIVVPVLVAGYYVGIKKIDEENAVELGDFFKSFDNWQQVFLFGLVSGLLIFLGFILLILPGIWFAVAVMFGYPLIVFAKLEFWDSIKTSVNLINKKWFHFFGLAIVLALINMVGALLLGIGLFITIPLSYGTIYACYKDVVGFGGTVERDITDHLVDDQL